MRFGLFIIPALFMVLSGSGCSGKAKQDFGKDFLQYRLDGDPPTLDVAHSTDTRSATILLKVFDGLVQYEPTTLKVIPAVAKSWTVSKNGLLYTFILRDRAFFHNGRKVVAQDFKYSFERILNPKTASERVWVLAPIKGAKDFSKGEAREVAGIVAVNDSILQLHLEAPFAPFMGQLCMEAASVVPSEEVAKGEAWLSRPVGCGPFQFVSWNRGNELLLKRFDKFYGDSVPYAGIRFKILPSVEVAFQQYLSGELDFLDELPQGRAEELRKQRPAETFIWPILGIYYIGFNLEHPPFAGNLALRQAFCRAVDRKQMCRAIFEDMAEPAAGILPPGIEGYDSTITGYPYDALEAKRLLAQAGYPGGRGLPVIRLWFNQNERHRKVAQYLQSLLADLGVKIELKEMEWGTYLGALQEGEPALFRLGWVADLPDADNFLYPLLHSSEIGKGDNFTRFRNSEFDSLVETARAETDAARRTVLYKEADSLATEQAVWIMISYSRDACLLSPKWKGLELSKQGDFAIPFEKLKREKLAR